MMKRILGCFLACCLLCGCAVQEETDSVSQWLETAALDAHETPEELYAQALSEDTLIVYSNMTRIYDTQTAFEDAYPGLNTDVQFVRSADLIALLEEHSDPQNPLCDIVVCTDNEGILSSVFVEEGLLYKYVPYDMEEFISPQYNDTRLDFMIEGGILFYNSEAYSAPPISNWWELTEPRFRGKFYMVDPQRSHTTNVILVTMIQHSDEMAQAYLDLYGKPLDIPEGSSAGQEFWRMLMPNITFTSSSDEALEMVGMPGQSDPPMAILVSSKERKSSLGYAIKPIYDTEPVCGVLMSNSVMIHSSAENTASAKLFIRFLLGESDGTGAGFAPYLHQGLWPVRSDVHNPRAVQLEDVSFWQLDDDYMMENQAWITEFWRGLRQTEDGETP